jgi:hypothetical protein
MRMGREPPAHRQQIPFGLRRDIGAIHELKFEFGLSSDQCHSFIDGIHKAPR